MVSHSSFFRYLHVFSAWNGRQGHDGLVAGCFFTKVGFKRMGNGSVILCRILCFATALAETGTQKFFSTSCYTCKSRCTCSTDRKNSHCTKNVHCDVSSSRCFEICNDCMVSVIHRLWNINFMLGPHMEWLLMRELFETVQTQKYLFRSSQIGRRGLLAFPPNSILHNLYWLFFGKGISTSSPC